jgi:hypothetical protein
MLNLLYVVKTKLASAILLPSRSRPRAPLFRRDMLVVWATYYSRASKHLHKQLATREYRSNASSRALRCRALAKSSSF